MFYFPNKFVGSVDKDFLSAVKVIFWFGCGARNWNPGSYLIFRAYVVLGNVANGYVLPKNMTLVIELTFVK